MNEKQRLVKLKIAFKKMGLDLLPLISSCNEFLSESDVYKEYKEISFGGNGVICYSAWNVSHHNGDHYNRTSGHIVCADKIDIITKKILELNERVFLEKAKRDILKEMLEEMAQERLQSIYIGD
jgi:hypothetical protein